MGQHRYRQLKLKGTLKPYKHKEQLTKKDIKNNKIKHLQRYQGKILKSEIENLPALASDLYSYLIKKSIITDERFIKNELITQINMIIDAYKHTYNPMECREIEKELLKQLTKNYDKNTIRDKINETSSKLRKNFHAIKYFFMKK